MKHTEDIVHFLKKCNKSAEKYNKATIIWIYGNIGEFTSKNLDEIRQNL